MVDGLQHGWGQCSPVGLICPGDKMRLGFSLELGPMAEWGPDLSQSRLIP